MAMHVSSRGLLCFAVAVLAVMCASHAVGQVASPAPDSVSLSESTITWSTVTYATDAENGLVGGSLDEKAIVDRTFKTHVLENRYLRVTLLPEFGGRILFIIFNPTRHEQLYHTEDAQSYGIEGGSFDYDSAMGVGWHVL